MELKLFVQVDEWLEVHHSQVAFLDAGVFALEDVHPASEVGFDHLPLADATAFDRDDAVDGEARNDLFDFFWCCPWVGLNFRHGLSHSPIFGI